MDNITQNVVCSQNHTEHIHTLYGEYAEFSNVTAGGEGAHIINTGV